MERAVSKSEPVWIWGLPLTPYTLAEALARIDQIIAARRPSYFITANLHYAMLTARLPELRAVNERATLILADGMPLVWASRLRKTPLPERVAGADLIWGVCEQAAAQGQRIFFLGGTPDVTAVATRKLQERYPGLVIAGLHSPPFRPLSDAENEAMIEEIRQARPDILILAFGQPKGEQWVARHYEETQVPFTIQLGASLDFVASKVRRAPRRIQRLGLEWVFRLAQEPRRLLGRYCRNIQFLIRMVFRHTRPARRGATSEKKGTGSGRPIKTL